MKSYVLGLSLSALLCGTWIGAAPAQAQGMRRMERAASANEVARSQAQGKIVVRLERIDGVAGFIGERKAP